MRVEAYGAGSVRVSGIGAVSRRSVVTVDPYNYGMNENGIWKTDANTFEYLDDPAVTKWLRERVDWARRAEIWGFHDSRLKQCRWQYPLVAPLGGTFESVSYNYEGATFNRGTSSSQRPISRKSWRYPVVVDAAGKVGLWQQTETNYGSDISWLIRSKPLDFGASASFKTLEMMLVEGTWEMEARLKVWALQSPEDSAPQLFHDDLLRRRNYMVDGGFEAPFFRFEIDGHKPAVSEPHRMLGECCGAQFFDMWVTLPRVRIHTVCH
jgi:hypothetical protein